MNSSHFCNQLYRRVEARERGLEGKSRQRMTDRVLCVSVLNTQGSRLLRVVLTETKIDGAKQILLFRSCRRVRRESENYTETNVKWLSVRLLEIHNTNTNTLSALLQPHSYTCVSVCTCARTCMCA